MTLLANLADVSARVGASPARLVKVAELAAFLRSLEPGEIRIGVQYLAGQAPQGRFGIGPSVLRQAAKAPPMSTATLSLTEVDKTLSDIAALRGRGLNSLRTAALSDLLGRATEAEQQFLLRLLLGELRQGALVGVMIDAIAAAAERPVGEVRRAMMYGAAIGAVARPNRSRNAAPRSELMPRPRRPATSVSVLSTSVSVSEASPAGSIPFVWFSTASPIPKRPCGASPDRYCTPMRTSGGSSERSSPASSRTFASRAGVAPTRSDVSTSLDSRVMCQQYQTGAGSVIRAGTTCMKS